ncbi:TIR domain-containing protein [Methanimicrococcus sp. OttesenSCG-928-J09]|nr:TIR domain-containing protein [Methanimicrococcus sp. OttesenSCG-928-J09]
MIKKRKVFFSFHYGSDSWRVSQIRNIGIVDGTQTFTDNKWEEVKRKTDNEIKQWIDSQISQCSCTVVLVGEHTADRKWINYEIKRSILTQKGLFGIYIHGLKDSKQKTCSRGKNPFCNFFISNDVLHDRDNLDDFIYGMFFGKELDELIPCYCPPNYVNSQDVYSYIEDNIQIWIEEAIKNASKNYGYQRT